MTKVIPLYDEDNETENTLMIYTGQCQYYNQIIIQKSEFENTYYHIPNNIANLILIYMLIKSLQRCLCLHNVSKVLP